MDQGRQSPNRQRGIVRKIVDFITFRRVARLARVRQLRRIREADLTVKRIDRMIELTSGHDRDLWVDLKGHFSVVRTALNL